jgi:hypothetical protein
LISKAIKKPSILKGGVKIMGGVNIIIIINKEELN